MGNIDKAIIDDIAKEILEGSDDDDDGADEEIKISIKVDTTELEKAIEKAKELKDILQSISFK